MPYHIPALLEETLKGLDIRPDGIYADATFGGGGHSRALLKKLSADGHLYSFDQDSDAHANALEDPRFTFVLSNFRFMSNFMRFYEVDHFDGIMADLGVSFHHFDAGERGFSFRTDAPLDMRMNRNAPLTAADLIAKASEEELLTMFRSYTDLAKPREVVKAIMKAREDSPLLTTFGLAEVVRPVLNPKSEKKELSQVFQALRIEVNHEMDALREFLESTLSMLDTGGRLAILTYHSVEDRMVKNFMKTGNIEGREEKDFYGRSQSPWKLITRKPIEASAEEVEANPRSRSAKLRIAEKI